MYIKRENFRYSQQKKLMNQYIEKIKNNIYQTQEELLPSRLHFFFKYFSMSLPFPFFLFIQALHDEYELALLGLAEQLKAKRVRIKIIINNKIQINMN